MHCLYEQDAKSASSGHDAEEMHAVCSMIHNLSEFPDLQGPYRDGFVASEESKLKRDNVANTFIYRYLR